MAAGKAMEQTLIPVECAGYGAEYVKYEPPPQKKTHDGLVSTLVWTLNYYQCATRHRAKINLVNV